MSGCQDEPSVEQHSAAEVHVVFRLQQYGHPRPIARLGVLHGRDFRYGLGVTSAFRFFW